MRIMLVEDDEPLAQGLKRSLNREGHAVDWVGTGTEAINTVEITEVDMCILDLGLPDMDGLQVLKTFKKIAKTMPVIILTARDGVDSKVMGLDLGADDYLAKPFEMPELLARVRVLERRQFGQNSNLITIGDVCLDSSAHLIRVDNNVLQFSRREYMIVKALMENAGRILSKAQLENNLYEWGEEVASNTIEVHISNVRKKLPVGFIKTVRGVGYLVKP